MKTIRHALPGRTFFLGIFSIVFLITQVVIPAQCGKERWPVKTGTDTSADLVNLSSMEPSTIGDLTALPVPRALPQDSRIRPTETTVFVLNCILHEYKLEDDSDYHIVLTDESGHTMIAEIPSPSCVGDSSPFASAISTARAAFDQKYHATKKMHVADVPVRIAGVGFFDFIHGQTGVAPNGIELHPVLSLSFDQNAPSVSEPPGADTTHGQALTNADILTLVAAGLAPEVIIAKIRTTAPHFDTSTSALIDLHRKGVSQEVIAEMIYRQAGQAAPSIPPKVPSAEREIQTPPVAAGMPQANPELTVYVTATGKKYHMQGCSSLRKSAIPMKLKDAIAAGYTPCSRCNPPSLSQSGASNSPGDVGSGTNNVGGGNTPSAPPAQAQPESSIHPSDKPTGDTTAKGLPIYQGPRGGHYHYSKSGKKVYGHKK